ncbi:MAG: hypothetical protein KDB82_04555 [Planctomycetes bacterium]|nr:hypothetical protein [Planctomycetota bacterium]
MKLPVKIAITAGLIVAVVVGAGVAWYFADGPNTYEVEKTHTEPSRPSDLLADDRLEDKHPVFDPDLIESRPLGEHDNPWQINSSAAVIKLDVRDIRTSEDPAMQRLYPDYASAAAAIEKAGYHVLPSVNLLGGKAKQFDDGLYAAMDLYMARNAEVGVRDVELCVRQVLTELMPTGEAYAWLWASLELGGYVGTDEYQRRPPMADRFIAEFLGDKAQSQPVGFYNWNEKLQRVFRFLRYLQQGFKRREGTPNVVARALRKNAQAREAYARMLDFYRHLTNPFINLSLLPLAEPANADKSLDELAAVGGLRHVEVAFLPSSDAPETELFERLYPEGMPAGADLMMDLIKAIRDGAVDLAPKPNSGWYDYQLHALETLLLPGKGPESNKLLLTKKYKLRLVEAFKAMVTKTRETHVRQMMAAGGNTSVAERGPPPESLSPRLRLEPNPTYYLRIARSYAFLQTYLMTVVENLNSMPGLRADGPRDFPLGDELENMRQLFYGLYFVSCDDIGLKPELLKDENADPVYHRVLAAKWLEDWQHDPDLAVDTRVGVPVYRMPGEYTRFWCTVGVRPIKLRASYVTSPSWRPTPKPDATPADWEEIESYNLTPETWVILGDDFVEVQRKGDATLTRKQLREVCDQHQTKQEIAAALAD